MLPDKAIVKNFPLVLSRALARLTSFSQLTPDSWELFDYNHNDVFISRWKVTIPIVNNINEKLLVDAMVIFK